MCWPCISQTKGMGTYCAKARVEQEMAESWHKALQCAVSWVSCFCCTLGCSLAPQHVLGLNSVLATSHLSLQLGLNDKTGQFLW